MAQGPLLVEHLCLGARLETRFLEGQKQALPRPSALDRLCGTPLVLALQQEMLLPEAEPVPRGLATSLEAEAFAQAGLTFGFGSDSLEAHQDLHPRPQFQYR